MISGLSEASEEDIWSKEELEILIKSFADKLYLYFKQGVLINFDSTITPLLYPFLPINQKKVLFYFHWLISHQVQLFLKKIDGFFRKIPIQSENFENISRGKIEGSPNWSKTFQIRIQQSDSLLFASINLNKLLDNIELQIIKRLLLELQYVTSFLMKSQYIKGEKDWYSGIQKIRIFVENRLSNVIMTQVSIIPIHDLVESQNIMKLKTPIVNLGLKILVTYYFQKKNYENLIEIHKSFSPNSLDKLFELFVVFQAVDELIEDNYTVKYDEIELISTRKEFLDDSSLIFVMKNQLENSIVKIYYQNSSFVDSEYKKMLRHFNLGLYQVFDILVLFENVNEQENKSKELILLEVKRSMKRETLKSGLTQILFYFNILSEELNNCEKKGILVCWKYPEPTEKEIKPYKYGNKEYKFVDFSQILSDNSQKLFNL